MKAPTNIPRRDDEASVSDTDASQMGDRFSDTTVRRLLIVAIVFVLFLVILAFAWTPFGAP